MTHPHTLASPISAAEAKGQGVTLESSPGDFWALLKPRVMSLVIFTAGIGMSLAPGSLHPFLAFVAILCIAGGAGGAGALNMWYEHKTDALMRRTSKRPLPQGRVQPSDALALGIVISAASVLVLGLAINHIAAFLLAFTIFFYACVYTIWLKPRTAQNIVIGGASGALPPVIGWYAVTPTFSFEPLLLFLIIFIWTPSHFWALALSQVEDYRKANIPMLPVIAGSQNTRQQIWIYSLLLVACSFLPYTFGYMGPLYLLTALGLGLPYLYYAHKTREKEAYAMSLFKYSILYLFVLFLIMPLDRALT